MRPSDGGHFSSYANWEEDVGAAVTGPLEMVRSAHKDKAMIEVTVVPWSGQSGAYEKMAELFITSALNEVIMTDLYPRSVIGVSVQCFKETRCLMSAGLNAAMVAILKAGIACSSCAVGVTVGQDSDRKLFAHDVQEPPGPSEKQKPAVSVAVDSKHEKILCCTPTGSVHESDFLCFQSAEIVNEVLELTKVQFGKIRKYIDQSNEMFRRTLKANNAILCVDKKTEKL